MSEASLKYNPETGKSYYYAAVGETLTWAVAKETLMQQKNKTNTDNEITKDMVFARQEELMKAGYGFVEMKAMVDKGQPFGKIAEKLLSEVSKEKSSTSTQSWSDKVGGSKSLNPSEIASRRNTRNDEHAH